jgi:hypothetical protein
MGIIVNLNVVCVIGYLLVLGTTLLHSRALRNVVAMNAM